MSNALRAEHYADRAMYETVTILANQRVAANTFRLRFSTTEMGRRFLPGQFLMVRIDGINDPLIGRPFALYDRVDDANSTPIGIDFVYLVDGKLTSRLVQAQVGDRLNVWGPLGNGFVPRDVDHLIIVAGGIGQTPFLTFAKEILGVQQFGEPVRSIPKVKNISLCYGARSADYHAGVDDFRELGMDVRLASDDGSIGHNGFVTDVLRQKLSEIPTGESVHVACCGPEAMMEAVAALTSSLGVSCDVSLEEPMACGVGICFTCVARIRTELDDLTNDGQHTGCDWDYQRTCVEGPVYDARRVVWHA